MFRELLQNSDDAGARSVEIRFETEEYLSREKGDSPQSDESKQENLPDLKTAVVCGPLSVDRSGCSYCSLRSPTQVHQWTFKNNGMQFRDEDWSRLKKIGAQAFVVAAVVSSYFFS